MIAISLVAQFSGKTMAALGTGLLTLVWILEVIGVTAVALLVLGGVAYLGYVLWKPGHGQTTTWYSSIVGISPLGIAAIAAAALGVGAWAYFGLPTFPGGTAHTSPLLQSIAYLLGIAALAGCIYFLIVGKKSIAQLLGVIGLLLLVVPTSTLLLYKEKINQILVELVGGITPIVTTTVADDGPPPLKIVDAVLGMMPITQKKPKTGCVVAFGPGSEYTHMQLTGSMYYFTAERTVQVQLGWFPAQSNKCN